MGRCDEVDSGCFESFVDVLDTCSCKYEAIANEWCGLPGKGRRRVPWAAILDRGWTERRCLPRKEEAENWNSA